MPLAFPGRAIGPFSVSLLTALLLSGAWSLADGLATSMGPRLLACSFFLLAVVLLPLSLVLSIYLRLAVGGGNPYEALGRQLGSSWRWLLQPSRERCRRLTGLLVWGSLYLAAATAGAVALAAEIAARVVQPRFQALLSVAAVLLCLALAAPIPLLGYGLSRRRRPSTSDDIRSRCRPLWPLMIFMALVSAAAAAATVLMREAIAAAPWQQPLLLAASGALGLALAGLLSRAVGRPVVAWLCALAITVAIALGFVRAASLAPDEHEARRALSQAPATGVAYSLISALLDRDGDGFMHTFGGGDCAPDDSAISPVAIEVPGNGIDEDCSGEDLILAPVEAGRWDYPTPFGPGESPPVILVTVDALSAGRLGVLGYHRELTPTLDRWSERCVTFELAFSSGPSTRLSLASAMTGLYDTQVARGEAPKVPHPILEENLTLAELLREAGYETVFVSPNSYFHRRWKGFLQGFGTVDRSAARDSRGPVHNADAMTRAALRQLRKPRTNPLFLWVHYYDPHPPFGQPPGVEEFGDSPADRYDAEVLFVDRQLGPLLDEVERRHGDNGYVLIIGADHGAAFDSLHSRHAHGYDLHSAVLHVPLLFCSPAFPPRRVRETPVSLLDLAPTVVNLTGVETGVAFPGSSLVPLLTSELEWPERAVFHQFNLTEKRKKGEDPLYAVSVRTNRFNYIWDRKLGLYHLYDYRADPEEERNLVGTNRVERSRLDSLLKNWLHELSVTTGGAERPLPFAEQGGSDGASSYDD